MKPPRRYGRRGTVLIRFGTAATLAVVVGLAAGCNAGTSHDGKATAHTPLLTFHRYGLEFRYPAAWPSKEEPALTTSQSMLITYLTPSRLHNPCRTWTSRSGGGGTCRGYGIKSLPPHGVFVMWWLEGVTAGELVAGSRQTIGGDPAVVSEHDPAACGGLGAQVGIVAAIRRSWGNWYVMTACLRGPGLPEAEAAVRAMLRSVHVNLDASPSQATRRGLPAALIPKLIVRALAPVVD